MPEVLFATDAAGAWTYLNPAWTRMTGFEVAESLGHAFLDFIWTDDRDRHSAQVACAIANGEIQSRHEVRYHTRNGGYRWVRVQVNLERDPDGHPCGTCGTLIDITDRRLSEALSMGEQSILKAIVGGAALEDVLDQIRDLTQTLIGGKRCSIFPLDPETTRRRHETGSSPAAEYGTTIDGIAIGPAVESRGPPTHTKRPMIVANIASDPPWGGHGDPALDHAPRTGSSFPILGEGGEICGTFAIHHEAAQVPDDWELGVAQRLARLAAVVILRQRADDALRISEERYALAVQGSSVGIFDWDIARGTLHWSSLYKRMVGLAPEEEPIPRVTFNNLLHPDDRERVETVLQRHLTERVPYDTSYRLRRKDGSVRWFQARAQAVWDDDGRAIRLAGSIQDITERVEATQQLRDSEIRFRDMTDTASDWFWETDGEDRFTYLSDRLFESTGVDPATLLGRRRRELSAEPTDRPHWRQYFADLTARRPFRDFEYAAWRPDHEPLWFRVGGKPVIDDAGRFQGYRGTGTNITAQRLAEDDRRRSEAHAIQAERTLIDAIESLSKGRGDA